MDLGKRIKIARQRRGFTQPQLAKLASNEHVTVSQAALSALEVRNSETSTALFDIARALRVNPEWLQTGRGESGLDMEAWKPAPVELAEDEKELLTNYRAAGKRWRLSLLLMSRLRGNVEQEEAAGSLNTALSKIAGTPISDERLGDKWTRPDRPVRSPRR